MKAFWSLGSSPLWSRQQPEYTGERVRYWLREDLDSVQAQRVRRQVECLGMYIHDPRLRSKYRGLESYHKRLPSIVSMYLRGLPMEEIADYYRPVFTTYGIDRSLEILTEHIALRLNKDL